MSLDPDVARLLASYCAPAPGPDGTFVLEEMRRAMAAGAVAGSRPGVGAVVDRTIPVGDSGRSLAVRIYRPTQPIASPSPGVVYFHGGGWAAGGLDTHDAFVGALTAATSFTFVAVDYRLAPEHPFPAAVDDSCAATAWVSAHADELGIDAHHLAVVGDSAGANLAAVVALTARNRGGPPIAFQALLCPSVDMDTARWPSMRENGRGYLVTCEMLEWYFDMYIDAARRRDPRASPIHAEDLSGLPRTLVVTAEFDPLRDEGEAYAKRLADAGVPVLLARYDGQIHGFMRMDGVIARAADAQRDIAGAIRDALSAEPSGS